MTKTIKKRAVAPLYLAAAVWAAAALFFSLHTLGNYILTAAVSVAVFFLAKLKWKDTVVTVEEPDPIKEEPKPTDPALAELMEERDRAISELRRLNDSIKDETISAQIDRLEETTRKILSYVLEHPEKKAQIRTFLNYYLPTTLKLLNTYDRMADTGGDGENIAGSKAKIQDILADVVKAFDKQLDGLFSAEAMDVSADIKVREAMLAREGLNGSDFAPENQTNA